MFHRRDIACNCYFLVSFIYVPVTMCLYLNFVTFLLYDWLSFQIFPGLSEDKKSPSMSADKRSLRARRLHPYN